MKFVCFGYLDTERWSKLSPAEQTGMMDACFAYDEDVLKKGGHWVGGEGLQGPKTAANLRFQNGKVMVTDGPFVETKELLGGLLILEARDLNQAIELMTHHPGSKMGPWEIRPAADMTEIIRDSQKRRAAARK